MPKYFAAGCEVRLCTTSLTQSTSTATDVLTIGKGKEDLENIESQLERASPLPERTIRDGEDNGIVRFLGDLDKRPFFLVRAGHKRNKTQQRTQSVSSAQSSTTPGSSSTLTSGSPPTLRATPAIESHAAKHPSVPASTHFDGTYNSESDTSTDSPIHKESTAPEALVLTVDTNISSFRVGSDGKPMDVKVDVFYNGVFVGYKLLLARYKSNSSKVFFSGHRLYMTLERPWVLDDPDNRPRTTSPGHSSYSSLDSDSNRRRHAYEERWQHINHSLYQEAVLRGVDKLDLPLPMTDYLTSLATYGFPDALADDTTPPLDVNMGVIDVVVSLGYGKKRSQDNAYSYGPTRLVDSSHHAKMPIEPEILSAITTPSSTGMQTPTASFTSTAGSTTVQEQEHSDNQHDSSFDIDNRPTKARKLRNNTSATNEREGKLSHLSAIEPKTRAVPREPVKIKLRFRNRDNEKTSSGDSFPPKPTGTISSQQTIFNLDPFSSSISTPSQSFSKNPGHGKNIIQTPASIQKRSLRAISRKVAQLSSPRRTKSKKSGSVMLDSYAWPIPPLSQNSVATYATPELLNADVDGAMDDDQSVIPGMCRQVRKERSGEFAEESVLMGVRFVVG